MNKPTIEDMKLCWMEDHDEDFPLRSVDDILADRWRHGTEHQFIAHRPEDDTYWSVFYRTDKDGDYNDFRDGELSDDDVYQVTKVAKTTYEWNPVKTTVA